MKKQILTFVTLLLISFTVFSCKEKSKVKQNPQTPTITQPELSNEQKAKLVLNRAKDLLVQLDATKDPNGLKSDLKNIFPGSLITQSRFIDGQWEFLIPEGGFSILFLLSSQEDFDKGCGDPVVMMTTNGNFNGQEFSFIILNPQWLNLAKTDADYDYLASAMLHEAVHCWQFFKVISGQRKQIESIEREKEAYTFQFEFLPIILKRNNLENITIPDDLQVKNYKDMLIGASKTDLANDSKLSMLSNLVFQKKYFKACLPLLVVEEK